MYTKRFIAANEHPQTKKLPSLPQQRNRPQCHLKFQKKIHDHMLTNRIVYTPQIKCYLVTYEDKEFIGDRRFSIRDWKQAIGDELTKSKTGRQAFARIVFNWIQAFWPLIFIYLWLTRPVDCCCNHKPVNQCSLEKKIYK